MFVKIKSVVVPVSKAFIKMCTTVSIIFSREAPLHRPAPMPPLPFIIPFITECQNTATQLIWERGNPSTTFFSLFSFPALSPSFSISFLPTGNSSDTGWSGIVPNCPRHHSYSHSSTLNSLTSHLFSYWLLSILLFPHWVRDILLILAHADSPVPRTSIS